MSHQPTKPLPYIQDLIIDASDVFDIPTTHGGICFGFACMALCASLNDTLDEFEQQILFINQYADDLETLKTLIEANPDDPQLSAIKPFLWHINIAQDPNYYRQFHGERGMAYDINETGWQTQDFVMAYEYLGPKGQIAIDISTYSFEHQELIEWCESVCTSQELHPYDHAQCMIYCSNHAIAMLYDPRQSGWIIMDANGSESIDSAQDMAKGIVTHSFQEEGSIFDWLFGTTNTYGAAFSCVWISEHDTKNWYQEVAQNDIFLQNSLKHPGILDWNHGSAFWMACSDGDAIFVKAFLDNTAFDPDQLNQTTTSGCTPLFVASAHGHQDIVDLLLTHDIEVDATYMEYTPLMAAAQNGYIDIVTVLLDAGADPDYPDSSGQTLLYQASMYGDMDLLNALLEHDAEVMHKDDDGYTALHIACQTGHLRAAQTLMKYDADLYAVNAYGATPLLLAEAYGYPELAETLLAA